MMEFEKIAVDPRVPREELASENPDPDSVMVTLKNGTVMVFDIDNGFPVIYQGHFYLHICSKEIFPPIGDYLGMFMEWLGNGENPPIKLVLDPELHDKIAAVYQKTYWDTDEDK